MNSDTNQTPIQKSDFGLVSLDIQYQGAWNEFNTRITQRQNLITIYTSLSITAIGVVLLPANSTNFWRTIYAVPLLSLLFSALLIMHEGMMGNLYRFMAMCEKLDAAYIIGYHVNTDYIGNAQKYRRIHDGVCATLVLGLNLISGAMFLFGDHFATVTRTELAVAMILFGCSAISLVMVYAVRWIR